MVDMGRVSPPRFQGVTVFIPEYPPAAVTAAYAIGNVVWTPLGPAGGFSGSRIWKGGAADGRAFCLKKSPVRGTDHSGLEFPFRVWMTEARNAGLMFVPKVEPSGTGQMSVAVDQHVWDLTEWMPGRADFHDNPADARLAAAITALAEIHQVWGNANRRLTALQPVPAVTRRVAALADWMKLTASGWRPRFNVADGPIAEPAAALWPLLPTQVDRAMKELARWRTCRAATQPCLCDVWHDHVLFDGDRVTGLIDYASAKVDHVAVDLARLLGSFVPDDPDRTE